MRKILNCFKVGILLICVLATTQWGCFGSGNVEDDEDIVNAFLNLFYFASRRPFPLNENGDGDIFLASASGGVGEITNLTGTSEEGDSDDHICLVDLTRFRTFFMSQRTDFENTSGDFDIFTLPSLGGPIVNLTDDSDDDGDDFCNAIDPVTGNLIFTSNRTYDGVRDPDIYHVPVLEGPDGGLIGPGTVENLTSLSNDDEFLITSAERFLSLADQHVVFASARDEADDNGIENCEQDEHIFSVDLNGSSGNFTNLSQQGDDPAGCSTGIFTSDDFCGVLTLPDADVDGGVDFAYVVFTSQQNVGDNSGQQFFQDTDIFAVDPSAPNVLMNLTDGNTPYDNTDGCERIVSRTLIVPGSIVNADDFSVIFGSSRQGAGVRESSGDFPNMVNPDGDFDLFIANIGGGDVNIEILTDNTPAEPFSGSGSDSFDALVGVCGTTAIFASERSDIEDNQDPDLDLFAVDFNASGVSQVIPLTNNPGDTGDNQDCFLGCDETLSSAIFVSPRTDFGNDHGPSGDTDIFRAIFRDAGFNLVERGGVTIENLTDTSEGDDHDFALESGFFGSFCNNLQGNNVLESEVPPFIFGGGMSLGGSVGPSSPLIEDDFGFAITAGNSMLFTSIRTSPVNTGEDVDVFSQQLPALSGAPSLMNLVNRTDEFPDLSPTPTPSPTATPTPGPSPSPSPSPSLSSPTDDGIEAFVLPLGGPFN